MSKGRLLWTDDDPPGRFEYEAFILEDEGWEIRWAPDVTAAAIALSKDSFDAMILDQMLPYEALRKGDPLWGGCLLLRWLRGKAPPPNVSLDPTGPLTRLTPGADNRDIPVVVVSAFHDPKVEAAMRDASELDRGLVMVPKPIDINALASLLRRAGGSA